MANPRVPSVNEFRRQIGSTPEVRTIIPRQEQLPQQSVGANALVQLGGQVVSTGQEFARIGAINQARDEDREAQARSLRFRQDIFDLTYGNKDKNIQGYTQLKGQAALDQGQAFRAKIEELRRTNAAEITSPRVQATFNQISGQSQLSSFQGHAAYINAQRNIAEAATDNADLQLLYREMISVEPFTVDVNGKQVLNPHLVGAKTNIVKQTLKIATQDGFVGKENAQVRADLVKNNLAVAHEQVIDNLLSQDRAADAAVYFDKVIGEIPNEKKAVIRNKIKATGELEAGRTAANQAISTKTKAPDRVSYVKGLELSAAAEKEALRLVDAQNTRDRIAKTATTEAALSEAFLAAEGKHKVYKDLNEFMTKEPGKAELVRGHRNFPIVLSRESKAIEGTIFATGVTAKNKAIVSRFKGLDSDVEKAAFDLTTPKDKLTKDQFNYLETEIGRAKTR